MRKHMSNTTTLPKLAKVTGVYRWADGAHFDHAYYGTAHARLTTELLAPLGLLRFESDRTVGDGSPQPGEVVATSNAYFATIAEAHTALRKAGAALAADLANYTNIRPMLHVSEVLLHRQ
jgi:uncharacterized protein (TIGR02118 family)